MTFHFMKESRFAKPLAIDPKRKMHDLIDSRVTRVSAVDSLPEDIKKGIPDGFVLKVYKTTDEQQRSLFGSAFQELSESQKAAILKKRYQFVRASFNLLVPGLVLETDFFVSKDGSGKKRIFEVQRQMTDFVSFEKVDPEILEKFSPEVRRRIVKQLNLILTIYQDFEHQNRFPEFRGLSVDFVGKNNLVLLLQTGEWRILDTNYLVRAVRGDTIRDGDVSFSTGHPGLYQIAEMQLKRVLSNLQSHTGVK